MQFGSILCNEDDLDVSTDGVSSSGGALSFPNWVELDSSSPSWKDKCQYPTTNCDLWR